MNYVIIHPRRHKCCYESIYVLECYNDVKLEQLPLDLLSVCLLSFITFGFLLVHCFSLIRKVNQRDLFHRLPDSESTCSISQKAINGV